MDSGIRPLLLVPRCGGDGSVSPHGIKNGALRQSPLFKSVEGRAGVYSLAHNSGRIGKGGVTADGVKQGRG